MEKLLPSTNNFESNTKFLKYKYKLINTILIISIFTSFLLAFLFIFIDTFNKINLMIILELSYGFFNLFLYFLLKYNKNNLNLVTYLSMFCLYILQVIIMINILDDSFREAWFFLTIIASFFLGGRIFGYIMSVIIFITMSIYNFQTIIPTNLNTIESILPIILLVLIVLVINLYELTKEKYACSLNESNALLENKIKELHEFNNNLEIRVKEEIEANRRHEHKIFEQSKMVTMGEMMANIAHQWRQPLSAISLVSTSAKLKKDMGVLTDEIFSKDMDIIHDNSKYLSQTIDDFRNFISGDRSIKLFNLSYEINFCLHLMENSMLNNEIKVNLDLQEKIEIFGYANELKQCLLNIFYNSKDALKKIKDENKLIFVKTYIKDKKAVITLTDSAGGISDKIMHKIFEAYFTTKGKEEGTGIGLHMTYKLIVDGMQGTINAKNVEFEYEEKKYKGAEFKIVLPLKTKDKIENS